MNPASAVAVGPVAAGAVLDLELVAQNAKTVTVRWTPVGCLGYALYRGVSQKPVSNTWDATKDTWTVSRVGGTIRVVALGAAASGTYTPQSAAAYGDGDYGDAAT